MPRKTLTIAAVALALAGAGVLTNGYADWAASGEVARLLADRPGWRVGAVRVDRTSGRVTLRDVSLKSGALQVRARSVDLPVAGPLLPTGPHLAIIASAFAQAPGAPAPAGTASASDVTIVQGPTTYTIKKIDLTGTSLGNADLAALLDRKTPDGLATRLQKFKADTVTLSDVTSVRKGAGMEARASLPQVVLSKVGDGRIGAASIAASTASTTGPQSTSIKTGAIQAKGIDLALLERIADTVRTDDAEPLKTLADSVTINDLSVTNPDKNTAVAVGSIVETGFKARPFKTDVAKLGEPMTGDPVTDKVARNERAKAFVEDLAGSIELAGLSMDHLSLSNADPEGPGKLAIAGLAMNDYRDRRLGAVKVRDFVFEGPSARFSLGAFDLADIALPPAGARDGDPAALSTDAYPSIGKADITAIVVDAGSSSEDGSLSKVKFKVAHVGSSGEREAGRFPTSGAISVEHVTFDVPDSDGPGNRELRAMGYRQVDLSGGATTAYDRKLQTLAVQKLLISGVGMGSVTFAFDFANVSQNILSANPSVAKASAFAMLLKRFDLRVLNEGLFEKGLAFKAEQDGKSVADERGALTELFTVTLPEALGNGVGIKTIGAAIAAFVAEPKTLHVSLASKQGLGAADIGLLGSPDALLGRLEIQAEANK